MVVLYFWCAMGLAEESGVVGMLENGALEDIMLLMYGWGPCLIVLCGPFGGSRISIILMGLSAHLWS